MNENKSPQNASEVLQSLYDGLQEDVEEIRSQSLQEINQELSIEGIDSQKYIAGVPKMFWRIKAKESLNKASEKRKEILSKIKIQLSEFSSSERTRENLMSLIKTAFNLPESKVVAYCRKFEDASDGDLESLLSDLVLLDDLNEELNEN